MTENASQETPEATETAQPADPQPDTTNPLDDPENATQDVATEIVEDDSDSGARKARREAKQLRDRLGKAESDLETTTAHLTAMRTAEITRQAQAAGLRDGNDLLLLHPDLVAFAAEDGTVSADAVKEATEEILRDRPHWCSPSSYSLPSRPKMALIPGHLGGDSADQAAPSWSSVLNND